MLPILKIVDDCIVLFLFKGVWRREADLPVDTSASWWVNELQSIMRECSINDIYNADETSPLGIR